MVIISFCFFTGLVALWSLWKFRTKYTSTLNGFFLAGKSNSFWMVGAGLLLTNLSANQFIGENESVYINNLSVIGWGVSSVVAMLLVSEFLLPIYFKHGFHTVPDFLSLRFDPKTKILVSMLILIGYIVNLLPPVLYGGALSLATMFDVPGLLHISYWQSIWLLVWALGIIGSFYSILGGLKLISLSDLSLGLCLFMLALLIPIFAFWYLGSGDIWSGVQQVFLSKKEHLNAVGNKHDAIPFSTLFTGMLLINFYYWGMEPYIAQQALSAKNLTEAQKGMTLAAGGKLFMPLLINLPGLLAVHLLPNIEPTASVFPKLILHIFPDVLIGFSLALVFGAAMTTYTAGLQSCGSLFIFNIYKPYLKHKNIDLSEIQLVKKGKYFELIISLSAMFIAPFILFAHDGFYTYLQTVSGLFNMPIFTIMIMGILSRKITSSMAQVGLFLYMISYFVLVFIWKLDLHYLHLFALLFLAIAFIMWIGSKWTQPHYLSTFQFEFSGQDRASYWKGRYLVGTILLLLMVSIYLIFSPLGLAR
ncbi:solute:sodium symporter family transporter [Sphingobacterium sp. SRCM116780]|uniref:solute:sodium symporter family transporter n=1 Tax=Sphingobacterium sp. SRCM116780 TaxID=2907623 RepID=UPI001F19C363|nr:solute:sodium symporter family transporter [Sphingobacterium sp. SRCM116780]UIR54819.1 solute:sodium symporter family transporter [Sphingobacterium sp. SRCM116780]